MPMAFSASLKYSRGLTRTRAPVGQFSWQEYAGTFAPFGLSSGLSEQRLHLTASKFSESVTAEGSAGTARPCQFLSQLLRVLRNSGGRRRSRRRGPSAARVFLRIPKSPVGVARRLRAAIHLAAYRHCVEQPP